MNGKQLDFGSLFIPSLASESSDILTDACALSDPICHPTVSRRSSSAKSLDSSELTSENFEGLYAVDELVLFFTNSKLFKPSKFKQNEKKLHMEHRNQPMIADRRFQETLPPPRRFYRRFWHSLSKRLMEREMDV